MTLKKHNYQLDHPNKGKCGKNHTGSKEVLQYTTEGILIAEFGGVKEAGRKTGIPNQNISSCCRGMKYHKTAGGFIWKFKS